MNYPIKNNNANVIYYSDPNVSFAIPNTNLEFASLCLRNALELVLHIENDFKLGPGKPESTSKLQQNSERTQSNPSKGLTQHTFQKLKCAVLAAYSYVQISLGEYLLALKQAQELLKMPNLPDPYAYVVATKLPPIQSNSKFSFSFFSTEFFFYFTESWAIYIVQNR